MTDRETRYSQLHLSDLNGTPGTCVLCLRRKVKHLHFQLASLTNDLQLSSLQGTAELFIRTASQSLDGVILYPANVRCASHLATVGGLLLRPFRHTFSDMSKALQTVSVS